MCNIVGGAWDVCWHFCAYNNKTFESILGYIVQRSCRCCLQGALCWSCVLRWGTERAAWHWSLPATRTPSPGRWTSCSVAEQIQWATQQKNSIKSYNYNWAYLHNIWEASLFRTVFLLTLGYQLLNNLHQDYCIITWCMVFSLSL